MKNKGFTLIELLAVIIILGLLMLIAIPSVTTYINNSKKTGYIDTAKQIIKGATAKVNSGDLDVYDTNTTYYIPNSCVELETGGDSPFGKFDPAYVVVTYDNESYNYYWTSRDTSGMGIKKLTIENELETKLIESGIKTGDIKTTTGIGTRQKILVLKKSDCTTFEESPLEDTVPDNSRTGKCTNGKTDILCKRATTLHTEICNTSDMCGSDGNSIGGTITYGQLGSSGLNSGDAFNCDVNGDGIYDEQTERFYYVSSYFDTVASAGASTGGYIKPSVFDDTYAVLIYYNNYASGRIGANVGSPYSPTNDTTHGPTSAVSVLPTTSEWCNIELKTTNRRILAEDMDWHNNTSTQVYDEGYTNRRLVPLPESFSYSGKAARLLTAQEAMRACGLSEVGNANRREILTCKFFLENTEYIENLDYDAYENNGSINRVTGFFLETPNTYSYSSAYSMSAWSRIVGSYYVSTPFAGVRPAIEVPLSRMEY